MWYVIQVMTGHEQRIAQACRRYVASDTEEVFVPVSEIQKKIGGRREVQEKLLFPGYVFFSTERVEALFFRLKGVRTLTKILRTGEEFTPLYDTEQAALEELLDPQRRIRMSAGYIEGDDVIITSGPLQGRAGKIIHIDRHRYTARLAVDFMGQSRSILVGLEIVTKDKRGDQN